MPQHEPPKPGVLPLAVVGDDVTAQQQYRTPKRCNRCGFPATLPGKHCHHNCKHGSIALVAQRRNPPKHDCPNEPPKPLPLLEALKHRHRCKNRSQPRHVEVRHNAVCPEAVRGDQRRSAPPNRPALTEPPPRQSTAEHKCGDACQEHKAAHQPQRCRETAWFVPSQPPIEHSQHPQDQVMRVELPFVNPHHKRQGIIGVLEIVAHRCHRQHAPPGSNERNGSGKPPGAHVTAAPPSRTPAPESPRTRSAAH